MAARTAVFRHWDGSPGCGDITVEVFQRERQFVGIEALGTPAELRPLKLFDDRLKSLDLSVAAFDSTRRLAYETLHESRIGWQIIKIDQHDRFYHNQPQTQGFRAFRDVRSANFSRPGQASKPARERASRCPRSASQAAPASA